MNADLATQMVTMRAASTQQTASLLMVRKQHEMDMSIVNMLAQAVQAAPPAGQGITVDKTA